MIIKETGCPCGKVHFNPSDKIIKGKGVLNQLPNVINEYNAKKAFVLCDKTTLSVAGNTVCKLLCDSHIPHTCFAINSERPAPDERSVGSVIMNFDSSCDIIIGVGSGVVNDIGKILAITAKLPYVIVATAPSMDGYASASSSMERNGVKVSLSTKCPNVIIGDTDILKNAPLHMLKSGLGDMIAKYTSICEWRIARLLVGEHYCEEVAELIRCAVKLCVDNAKGLMQRDEKAVEAVFEGLVLGGIAMSYAGSSRPASGAEHYFSHIWDMRGLEFGLDTDLHGIQCAVGTLIAVKIYEKIKTVTPDRQKALSYVSSFDFDDWSHRLCDFLGRGAKSMIELEAKEGKYDLEKHAFRLEKIFAYWDEILKIIDQELPTAVELENLLDELEMPKNVSDIGVDPDILPMTFKASKDIRDKYVLPRLCWDLGIIDEII